MPPMTTRTADDEGFITDASVAYYMARVRGGTGLITVEMASLEKAGRHRRPRGRHLRRPAPARPHPPGRRDPRGGAKASIQLGHGGGHTRTRTSAGETPIAPSAIPHPVYETTLETIIPAEMTKPRIDAAVAVHVSAALRAQKAGVRLCRDPRRAYYPDLAIPCTVREPAHRPIWRQSGQPCTLRARRAARGQGRSLGMGVILPALGRGFLPGRLPWSEGRRIAIRGRRPAPTRLTSPPGTTARCRRRRSCCRR